SNKKDKSSSTDIFLRSKSSSKVPGNYENIADNGSELKKPPSSTSKRKIAATATSTPLQTSK
ncbi:MAG: hypothetical protein MHPSP_003035, partial [Paramarteilia canceri]